MSKEKEIEKKVAVNKTTPLEAAIASVKPRLKKLYAAMEPADSTYGGNEVCEAIGLSVNDENLQAVGLAWHQLYDEKEVPEPQFRKPVVVVRGKIKLPKVF